MEDNKENYNCLKHQTSISLPVDTSPPVLKSALLMHKRAPLTTINLQAGASTSAAEKTPTPQKVDARHITLRDAKQDSKFKVYKDKIVETISFAGNESNNGLIKSKHNQSMKVYPSTLNDSVAGLVKNAVRLEPIKPTADLLRNVENPDQDRTTKPVTPSVLLEHNRVKNIKQSLKRSHSRELQGLSPVCKARRSDDCPQTRPVVRDSIADRLKSLDQLNKKYSLELTQHYNEEVLSYLIAAEKRPCTEGMKGIPGDTRACVLNWLMKINGPNGNPAILQTAFWYLDTILRQQEVELDKLQLIATACYWIGLKLYQPGVSATRLARCANNAFSAGKLIWVEMVLLKSLNFPAQPIIPNDFITFFASFCEPDNPGEIEVAATFLCMSAALVSPGSSLEYPSSVAAAAVMNAVQLIRKLEDMNKLLSCPVYISAVAKSKNFGAIMSSQRIASRKVANVDYAYNSPFLQYGMSPTFIAQKVVKAAGVLARMDSINLSKYKS